MSASPIVPADWDLPPELREQVGEFASRQRDLQSGGHLLLVFHQPPVGGVPERRSIILWRAPDGKWKSLREEGPERAIVEVDAIAAMQQLLRDYDARVDELEAQFAKASGARDLFLVLRETIPVKRALRNMVGPLGSARERLPAVRELLIWREVAHGTERAADLLNEEVRAALDSTIAEEAEVQSQANLEMARAAHRLNSLVALFLPLTAFGAAFGMNVASGLEDVQPWLFWFLLVSGIGAGFLLRMFIDRNSMRIDRLLRVQRRSRRHSQAAEGNGRKTD